MQHPIFRKVNNNGSRHFIKSIILFLALLVDMYFYTEEKYRAIFRRSTTNVIKWNRITEMNIDWAFLPQNSPSRCIFWRQIKKIRLNVTVRFDISLLLAVQKRVSFFFLGVASVSIFSTFHLLSTTYSLQHSVAFTFSATA